jgi:hypothetical protein
MFDAHLRRLALACAAAAAVGALAACYTPGGMRASVDRFTYESTTWQPKTVFVTDTRTGETIWSIDVPVGQQVVVGFETGNGPNEYNPDTMVWEVMPSDRMFGTLSNRRAAPPAYARRLEFELRPAPEYVDIQERIDVPVADDDAG